MSEKTDVAVVGGGIAGLVAAIELARAGRAAVLFERAPELGGRARSREQDGYVFNQGPHALYAKGHFRSALKEYGIATPGGPPALREARALWGARDHRLPTDLGSILRAAPLGFGERVEMARTFAGIARGGFARWRGAPFSEFTRRLRPGPRALLEAVARLTCYANAPERLDAEAALAQIRLGFAGVLYIDGGWTRLVDALAAVATKSGAAIHLGAEVVAVEPDPSGWRVRIEGRPDVIVAAAILAVPPEPARRLVSASQAVGRVTAQALPVRAMSLDLALRRLPAPKASFAVGIDRPLYFSVHSNSAKLAPEGGALVHASRYLGPEEQPDRSGFEELERLVERMQPGWRGQVAREARLAAMPVTHDFPRFENSGRMAAVKIADAPGLFLAGDWVGEGAMLSDAAVKSAREAAAAAARWSGAAEAVTPARRSAA